MQSANNAIPPARSDKTPRVLLLEELAVDLVITAAIVAGLVFLLHESLADVLTGPVFIVLVSASLIHLVYKYFRRRAATHG